MNPLRMINIYELWSSNPWVLQTGLEKPSFKNKFLGFFKVFGFLGFFSKKTDVAKHERVTQKHLKSASHRTHTLLKTNLQLVTEWKWRKWSMNLTNHNSNLNMKFI